MEPPNISYANEKVKKHGGDHAVYVKEYDDLSARLCALVAERQLNRRLDQAGFLDCVPVSAQSYGADRIMGFHVVYSPDAHRKVRLAQMLKVSVEKLEVIAAKVNEALGEEYIEIYEKLYNS